MFGILITRGKAPRPQHKHPGVASPLFASTSSLRLDLVSWYTSGYQ